MQISRNLSIFLVLCAVFFCAGCTQPAQPVTVPQVMEPTVIDPPPLGLTPTDLPKGFTLVESRTKSSSEMIQLALDLGWQGGYVTRSTSPSQDGTGGYEIIHSIALYPAKKMPDVIAYSEQQGQSDQDFAYTRFAVPGVGAQARGFSGTAVAQSTGSNRDNPMAVSLDNPNAPATAKVNFSQVIFAKGNTFEVVKLSGPFPDTTLLINLSERAYAKIP